jgi:hypothetical protein
MPFSSVPEVGCDCVFYPDGPKVADLVRAMVRLAADRALRDELRNRGLCRIQQFTWERTARATYEVYRSAVLRPSSRSLQMRRLLNDCIMSWSDPVGIRTAESMGIRTAWKALNFCLQRRIRREMKRLYLVASRRSSLSEPIGIEVGNLSQRCDSPLASILNAESPIRRIDAGHSGQGGSNPRIISSQSSSQPMKPLSHEANLLQADKSGFGSRVTLHRNILPAKD